MMPVLETIELPGRLSMSAEARDLASVEGVLEAKRLVCIRISIKAASSLLTRCATHPAMETEAATGRPAFERAARLAFRGRDRRATEVAAFMVLGNILAVTKASQHCSNVFISPLFFRPAAPCTVLFSSVH